MIKQNKKPGKKFENPETLENPASLENLLGSYREDPKTYLDKLNFG